MNEWAQWVYNERKRKKWNRARVAGKVGVHENTLGRWEHGDQPPLDMAKKVVEVLGGQIIIESRIDEGTAILRTI